MGYVDWKGRETFTYICASSQQQAVVIQLADAGVYEIVTDFDTQHEHWGSGCPTCGSYDYDVTIATAKIFTTLGESEVVFMNEQNICAEYYEQFMPTQADLMRLLLDADTLLMLKDKTLQEFIVWLKEELYHIYDTKETAYWEEQENGSNTTA